MNDNETSHWVFHFLRWFCPDQLYEEIEGDLIERFKKDVRAFGEKSANRRLAWTHSGFSEQRSF